MSVKNYKTVIPIFKLKVFRLNSTSFYIARRIAFGGRASFSSFIIKIAIAAVALSLAVMIISTAIIAGFKKEISDKIFGFWGHIRITNFQSNTSFENTSPIDKRQVFFPYKNDIEGVKSIQTFATKPAILMSDSNIEGIVLKGVGSDMDWSFFKKYLTEGDIFAVSDTGKVNSILISDYTARRLQVKSGDMLLVNFVQEQMRYRKLKVSGIYKTGLQDYDMQFALIDIGHIQHLNDWNREQVGGFSVWVDNVDSIDAVNEHLYHNVLGASLNSNSIRDLLTNIFDWIQLQQTNERIILALMILVAIINMSSALLILILERTNMIGILKALGADNQKIRRIFLYTASLIIGNGMLLGNALALLLYYIQQHFHIITLPEESYYLSVVPLLLEWKTLLLLNAGTFAICWAALILPTYLASRISIIKAIRFE